MKAIAAGDLTDEAKGDYSILIIDSFRSSLLQSLLRGYIDKRK